MPVLYLTEQGATVRKQGDVLLISKGEETLQELQAIKVEQVVVLGHINITTPAIQYFLQEGIDCVFCTIHGRYLGRLLSMQSGFGLLRQRQLKFLDNPDARLGVARQIARGKFLNQRTLLLRYFREKAETPLQSAADGIEKCLDKLDKARDNDSVMGLEGQASALYYGAFKELLKQDLGFNGRARRPPPDPVNALLSLGYTLLGRGIEAAVYTVGLDPFLGFLHSTRQSRPSLVLDMMEEFRPIIVDSTVLRVINMRAITDADFETPDPARRGAFLTQAGLKKFLHQYEERVQTMVLHPVDRVQVTYRRCFELQARRVARVIMGQEPDYQPFVVK